MFRGTTPSIAFQITSEFDLTTLKEVWITLKTWETEKTFEYSKNQITVDIDSQTLTILLTQEDTLAFEDGTVEVQMRVLDTSDFSYSTEVFEVEMERILKDGVIALIEDEDETDEDEDDNEPENPDDEDEDINNG